MRTRPLGTVDVASADPSHIASPIRALALDVVLASDKDVEDVVVMTVSDTNVIRRKPHQENERCAIPTESFRKGLCFT